MKITWYGHAAFRLETKDGVTLIIDPYESGAYSGALSYGKITDRADIALMTHDHADHNYAAGLQGSPAEVRKEGAYDIKGVKITAIPTFHDPSKGAERGSNLIFVIEADGLKIVHAGDLGHGLDQQTLAGIGKADVLFLPVGGYFTIDASEATAVMTSLKPAITIPMHFKTEKVEFPIAGVDQFTKGKANVKNPGTSEIEITREKLPKEPEIIVLRYAK